MRTTQWTRRPARARKSLRGLSGLVLGLAGLLGLGVPTAAASPPDLSRLEPAVTEQIEELRRVVDTLEAENAPPERRAAAHGALGHVYLVYELPDAARDAYATAARLASDDPRWPYYLGYLESRVGDLRAARDAFLETLRRDPADDVARLRLGEVELDLDDPEAARERFGVVLDRRPDSAAAHYGLGRAAAARGDLEEAVRHLERTVELQPDAGLAHYALAQVYRRLGRLDDARRALDAYAETPVRFADPRIDRLASISGRAVIDQVLGLAASPDTFPDQRFLDHAMGLLAVREGVIQEIDAHLARGGPDAPSGRTRARLEALVGNLLVFRDRDEEAIRRFDRALAADPEGRAARELRANALMRTGRPAEALQDLAALVEARPGSVDLRLKKAAAAMTLERFDEAREDLEAVLRVDPESSEARYRLGVTLERLGRPGEAIEHFLEAGRINTSPERAARAYAEAARLLAGAGRIEPALETFRRARDLDPELPDARLGLGGLLLNRGDVAAAREEFRRAVEIDSGNERAWVGEAISLLALARWAEAAQRLEAGVERLPGDPALRLLLARLRAAAPDAEVRDGERALELARGLHRERPSVRHAETLAWALAETGRFEEAAGLVRQALEVVRRAGDERLGRSLQELLTGLEAGRPVRADGPSDLIVLP